MRAKKPLWKRIAGPFFRPLAAVVSDLAGIAREMLAIPLGVWLALAELLGRIPLAIWRGALAFALALWRVAARAFAAMERSVTPVRAMAVVAAFAAVAVFVAQFAHYRAVAIGTPDYARVTAATAPEVAQRTAGSAHAYLLLPVAGLALVLAWRAFVGRGRQVALIALAGIAIVAVSLLIDAPKGLDEGASALQYEGAEARLLGPFWVQLFGGVVLIVTGALLAARGSRASRAALRGAAAPQGDAPFAATERWGRREART